MRPFENRNVVIMTNSARHRLLTATFLSLAPLLMLSQHPLVTRLQPCFHEAFSLSQLIFLSLIQAYRLYTLATSLVLPHLEPPHPILAETPVSEALQKSLIGDSPFVQDCRCLMRVAYEPRR